MKSAFSSKGLMCVSNPLRNNEKSTSYKQKGMNLNEKILEKIEVYVGGGGGLVPRIMSTSIIELPLTAVRTKCSVGKVFSSR